jgi:hypothetical protein
MNLLRIILLVITIWVLTACGTTSPPSRSDDICLIFSEKDDWYQAARASEARWGTPVPVLLAFIRHESGFDADAKPARRRILWFIPGPRPSDAYGYPQALDSTWHNYQRATSNRWAGREDFDDAVDFVGWYNDVSYRENGIDKTDAYRLYLAYHEGHGGYSRGSYLDKAWLQRTARRVAATAENYRLQLYRCP